MKRIMMCFLFAAISGAASAQYASQAPSTDPIDVGILSPDAASLGKFGKNPVSYCTGIPDINIPIYEIKLGNIKLPISLAYHAGGIKVDEIASSVGIGFALDAGGIISRNMVGLPDDQANGYLGTPSEQNLVTSPGNYLNYFYQIPGAADTDPDVFSYVCGGQSGKFIFNKDRTVFQIPKTDYKILYSDPTQTAGSSFKITDPNGITYIFDSYETMKVGVIVPAYASSWRLTKIVDQNLRDTVFLNYEYLGGGSEYLRDDQASFINQPQCYTCAEDDYGCQAAYRSVITTNTLYQTVNTPVSHNEMNLKDIEWRGGKITFTNSSDRLDRVGGRRVNEIDIYGALQGNLTLIKTAKFFQSYFYYNSTTTQQYPFTNTDQRNYRLRLDSVGFFSTDGLQPPQYYRMTYNTLNMASRESTGQDMWGFDNGQFNNQTLIPQQIVTDVNNTHYTIGNANRNTDSAYMQSCTLQSLTYPTGGKTVYELEPHRYQDPNTYVTESTSCSVLSGSGPQSATTNFVPTAADRNVRYTISFSTFDYNLSIPQPSVTILDQTTGQQQVFYSPDHTKPWSSGLIYSGFSGSTYNFQDGHTYVITSAVSTNTNGSQPVLVQMQISYETNSGSPAYKIGGGLRVKSVTNYDKDGKFINKDAYTYNTDSGEGYGTLMMPPWLLGINYQTFTNEVGCGSTGGGCIEMIAPISYIYHANPLVSVSDILGSPVLYSVVTKYQTAADNSQMNGKTVYSYNVVQDQPYLSGSFSPIDVITSNTWQNNYLKSEKVFKSLSAATWQLMTDKEYTYNVDRPALRTCLKVQPRYNFSGDCRGILNSASVEDDFLMTFYGVPTGEMLLHNLTSTTYDNSNNGLVVSTTYTYADTTHMFPTTIQTTSSKNDVLTKIMMYPKDFASGTNAYSTMVTRNIKAPVIQETDQKNGTQITQIKTNYADWYGDGKILMANSVSEQIGANPAETRVNFNKYNVYGNIIQQQRTNAPYQSYLWDYNNFYPVAEVINADSASIAYTSFEADGSGNWTIPSTSRNSFAFSGNQSYSLTNGAITKSGLNPAKKYIVSYWTNYFTPAQVTGAQTGYPVKGLSVNGWVYYEYVVSGLSTVSISGSGSVDELRLYPIDAKMTTYTYQPLVGMTSMVDPKNTITYYDYDSFQRLANVRDQYRNIQKSFCYNYYGQATNCSVNMGTPSPAPVINSLTNSGQARTVQVNFTPVPGCYTATITYTDLTTGTSNSSTGGCTSPVNFTVPVSGHSYAFTVTCYSSTYQGGITSLPVTILVNF